MLHGLDSSKKKDMIIFRILNQCNLLASL